MWIELLLGALAGAGVTALALRRGRGPAGDTSPDSERSAAPPPPAEENVPAPPSEPFPGHDRLSELGAGAMGVVHEVRERALRRTTALKQLRPEVDSMETRARFLREAQVTAQLQHPGIVPVYQLGETPTGEPWFTMRPVAGDTLADRVEALYRQTRADPSEARVARRSLLEAFHRVCETMAYAHSRRVVHRDLKPSNIMLGAYGEVLVLDWGVALVRESISTTEQLARMGAHRDAEDPVALRTVLATRVGAITGTPAYMSPEQARGDRDDVGPHSDVWSLGVMLYELLCGQRPFRAANPLALMLKINREDPAPLAHPLGVPPTLRAMVLRCLQRDPGLRYPDAGPMAQTLADWLAGASERERAAELLDSARRMEPRLRQLEELAKGLRSEAQDALENLTRRGPVAARDPRRRAIWRLEDEAGDAEQARDEQGLELVAQLRQALVHDPDLHEARQRLADHLRALHEEAERGGHRADSARLQIELAAIDDGRHADWLADRGWLSLRTSPPDARIELFRYEVSERQLKPVPVGAPLRGPLKRHPLPSGSYLARVEAAGFHTCHYPFRIERLGHWQGTGRQARAPIPLAPLGALGENEVYIPAGPFLTGPTDALRTVWLDGFVMQKHPVTNAGFLAFLNDLVARGRGEEALGFAPREQLATNRAGAQLYGRDERGHFFLQPDDDGDLWEPEWPVPLVDWAGARAYAAWYAERTGRPWRLPFELEWEKAARGVDGRLFPWGDFFDFSFCCGHDSSPGRSRPVAVGSFPTDESVYGARDMAGLTREWCLDRYRRQPPPVVDGVADLTLFPGNPDTDRTLRGGNWHLARASGFELAERASANASTRGPLWGFRLCHPL